MDVLNKRPHPYFPSYTLPILADLSVARKNEIENNIRAGINRLKSFQIAGGGLTYWPRRYLCR